MFGETEAWIDRHNFYLWLSETINTQGMELEEVARLANSNPYHRAISKDQWTATSIWNWYESYRKLGWR